MILTKSPFGAVFAFAAAVLAGPVLAADAPAAPPSMAPGPGGMRPAFEPPPPGTDPLALASARPSCDVDAQAIAKPALDQVRGALSAYQAKAPLPQGAFDITPRTATVDPSVAYYFELHSAGAGGAQSQLSTHGSGSMMGGGPSAASGGAAPGAADRRNSPQARELRALLACAYVTLMSTDEAAAKGVVSANGRPGLYYVPGTGLVAVRRAQPPGGR